MERILVGTDGSEAANRAVDAAAHLAIRFGAELLIVNASDSVSLTDEEMSQFIREEKISLGDALKSVSVNILAQAVDRAKALGLLTAQTQALAGDPAEQILAIAKTKAVDAIVVGRRGRSRLTGLLLGSVSQKLVSLAPCLVVVVP